MLASGKLSVKDDGPRGSRFETLTPRLTFDNSLVACGFPRLRHTTKLPRLEERRTPFRRSSYWPSVRDGWKTDAVES